MEHSKILDFLNGNQIDFELHHHERFFTVKESEAAEKNISGGKSKNIFLKDKKKNFFLVSLLSHKTADLKSLSKEFSKGGFSFASPDELLDYLGLTPGSVTPYGLINDTENKVTFLLDREFFTYSHVNFHPLRNDMTISVATQEFLKFCDLITHTPILLDI